MLLAKGLSAMSLWYLLLIPSVLMLLLFGGVLAWQILKKVTGGDTEVEFLGFKAKSPYVSAVMCIVGAGLAYTSITQINEENRVRVVNVSLSVDGRTGANVLTWNTRCPATVRLTGSITAVGRGPVSYQFVRKQGLYGEERTTRPMIVNFDGPGTISVVDNVIVPFPEGQYYYTDALRIVDPGDRQSEPVGFTVWCNPNTPPPPEGMPPPPDILTPP